MARYYCEDTATSALGRAIILLKGSSKTATRESMEQVSTAQAEIAKVKAKMAQTATEYVPIAKEDDPWTIREAAPAATVDEAVALVKEIIGGQTEKDIPKCTKCDPAKEMSWKAGQGKNGKPYGKFDCWTCKDVIWYEINKETGAWQPQKAKW
jgi:metal-dependent amidase/aminoacylase/carboxypeptidase family protein